MVLGAYVQVALLLTGPAASAPDQFEFHDQSTHGGRSVLQYRNIVLRSTPAEPLSTQTPFADDCRYGLVLVGGSPADALAVVWSERQGAVSHLWLDADGDGRLGPEERHVMRDGRLETTAMIAGRGGSEPSRFRRTILFRRTKIDDGLQYAVRGYRAGRLSMGDATYLAILTDGDANGLFDDAGADRIWIDLDTDGVLDGLTEQFLLGTPIALGEDTYTLTTDRGGASVRAHLRTSKRGRLRFRLPEEIHSRLKRINVGLISDIGELLSLNDVDQLASLPAAEYRVASLTLRLSDETGRAWEYLFRGGRETTFRVVANEENTVALLADIAFDLRLKPWKGLSPADSGVLVRPNLTADHGLYLARCTIRPGNRAREQRPSADIRMANAGGTEVGRTTSGFA